jgi:tetratricopeptide (TPR) repeat protein
VKPANILLGPFGETLVVDWGLAKAVGRDKAGETPEAPLRPESRQEAELTQTGATLGTPQYMSPEQAQGDLERLGPRTDVFNLGATLYGLLTGRPPYQGDSLVDVLRAAEAGDFPPPRRLDPTIDRALEAVCLKAMAREPEGRYGSAQALAEDIERWMADEPVTAWREPLSRRARRWARRHRQTVAALAAVAVLAVAGWRWIEYQRRGRMMELTTRVHAALRRSTSLRGRAQAAAVGDLAPWAEAASAAQGAYALLEPNLDPALRREVEALLADVSAERQRAEAASADRRLLARLVDIRSAQTGDRSGSATDAAYAEAFRAAGIDPSARPPDPRGDPGAPAGSAEGAQIRECPAAVRLALAAALDDWAAVRRDKRTDADGARRLGAAARAADPDPWRCDLRDALDLPDKEARLAALRALARAARFEELGPISLDLLGRALDAAGDADRAVAVLRAAQHQHPGDVWINYDLGRVLDTKVGRREEAIRAYESARALRPETAHELAHALVKNGESDEAIAVFQDLIRLRPEESGHAYCLGVELKSRGRSREADAALDAARARCEAAIRSRPDDARAHNSLGLVLRIMGRLDEAIDEFHEAMRLKPDYLQPHYNLANTWRELRRFDEAIAEFREAIRLGGDVYDECHHDLALALRDAGRLDEAIEEYREVVRLQRDDPSAHRDLAVALRDAGRPDEAIAAYREVLRLAPGDAPAHYDLALLLYSTGRFDEAIAAHHKALRLKPDDPESYFQLGNKLSAKSRFDEAIAAYREAIRLKPDDSRAHDNLGYALRQVGRFEEAIAACRKALDLKSDVAGTHHNLAIALRQAGRLREAIDEYRASIHLEPDVPSAHHNLAIALVQAGRIDEAIGEYREVLRLEPGNAFAHNDLAWALAMSADPPRRDPAEALAHARKAVELAPNNGSFYNTLGVAEYRAGNWDAAVAALRKAVDLKRGGDAYDWFGLALVEERLGHADEARAWFDKAVAWTRRQAPRDQELRRLWSEASERLGRPGPDDPAPGAPAAPKLRDPG